MPLTNFKIIIEGKLAGMGFPDREALLQLRDMGYKGILTLTNEPLCYEEIKYFDYHHIPLGEFKAPYLDQLAEAVEFIDSVNGPVVAHCQLGKSKTGCILGAYMIHKLKISADETVRRLKSIFNGYIELSEQVEALKDFERFRNTKLFLEDDCNGKIEIINGLGSVEENVSHFKVCVYENETEIVVKTGRGDLILRFKGDIGRKITKASCYI